MTRLLIVILCAALGFCARADYRILFLNTPDIEIGGKTLKVNDTFKDGATIKWTSGRQAMKVVDTKTREKMVLLADDFSKANASSLESYLARTKAESGASATAPMSSLASYLNKHFYLLGSLEIETGVPTDDRHYFFISYSHSGHEITKAVPNDNGTFTITPGIFFFNGRLPENDVRVKVYYCDKNADKITTVCDNMRIEILPKKIE